MARNTIPPLTKPLFSGRALNRTMLAKVFFLPSSRQHSSEVPRRADRPLCFPPPPPDRAPAAPDAALRRTPVGRLAALPPHLRQTEHNDVWRWWRTKQLWIPTAFISPDSNQRPNRKDEILLTFFGRGKSSSSSLLLLAKEMPSIYFKNGDSLPTAAPWRPACAAVRPPRQHGRLAGCRGRRLPMVFVCWLKSLSFKKRRS